MSRVFRFSKSSGFTVVELVVVVIVIAILAAIGIIGYGQWQEGIRTSQVKSDLKGAVAAMEGALNFENEYPADILAIFTPSDTVLLTGGSESDGTSFCINATSQKYANVKFYSQPAQGDDGIRAGSCSDRLAAPTGLTAQVESTTNSTASWNAVSGAASYELQRGSNSKVTRDVASANGSVTNATISQPTSALTLYFRARAVAADGAPGVWSNVVSTAGIDPDDT